MSWSYKERKAEVKLRVDLNAVTNQTDFLAPTELLS